MKKVLKNEFTWSVSRDSVLRECPRKYFFSYYGFWGGWETDVSRRVREIYVLKQLRTKAVWIGEVVHECIARSLQNVARGVPLLPVDEILSITRSRMRQDFRQSRSGLYWKSPKASCALFEHEYKIEVSNEEWREAADTVDRCLRNFYGSEVFAHLKKLQPINFLEIEERRHLRVDDMEIAIKLDCATREPDGVIVWDWKTGRRESNAGLSLQMACYAFYVKQVYHTPLEQIRTRRFDLQRSQVHEHRLTPRSLDEVLDYIRGSAKDMRGLLDDLEKNVADEERFRKVERREVCLDCNFLKVCKPDI